MQCATCTSVCDLATADANPHVAKVREVEDDQRYTEVGLDALELTRQP